jgi:ssRNA-specific RNase YbeY (16S rRNA maturation enzyme)
MRTSVSPWGKDAATDVLSFPQDSFGEVVVLGRALHLFTLELNLSNSRTRS